MGFAIVPGIPCQYKSHFGESDVPEILEIAAKRQYRVGLWNGTFEYMLILETCT